MTQKLASRPMAKIHLTSIAVLYQTFGINSSEYA